jgi:hypothetical protein
MKSVPFLPAVLVMFLIVYGVGKHLGGGMITLLVQIVIGGTLYAAFCGVYFFKTQNETVMKLFDRAKNFRRKNYE